MQILKSSSEEGLKWDVIRPLDESYMKKNWLKQSIWVAPNVAWFLPSESVSVAAADVHEGQMVVSGFQLDL